MDSYCDIKALPDPEIIQSAVVSELMQILHQLLPSFGGRVGLGFPAYGQQTTLGGIIRVLGGRDDLGKLHAHLNSNIDVHNYALLEKLTQIPDGVKKHAVYQRRQTKGNSHYQRMKKRHQSRGSWTDERDEDLRSRCMVPLRMPHIQLRSKSTGQNFLLFVERRCSTESQPGTFNGYGLGLNGATVPVF